MAELKAQTSAAGYAMSQQGNAQALKSYYGALLENPNVQAGLKTLMASEGTLNKADPYSTDFGGGKLASLAAHPGTVKAFSQTNNRKNKTTAAGGFQFLSKTWRSIASKLGLTDFGPTNQQLGALGLIDQAGGLQALVAGDLHTFVDKVKGVWASLPGSPYAQKTRSWGFVEDAWNNALNPNKDQLPGTAPTPYGPNAPQSFADARPENQNYAGPKGIFSVDTSRAQPIGHVSRSPLGPAFGSSVSPSRPDNANFSGPKGSFSVGGFGPSAPSTSSAKSPDRPDNHNYGGPVGMGGPGGTYVDKASAAAATAATHAAASAQRAAATQAPSAPSVSATSPGRPDTLGGVNYSSPKGVFSVDPGAKVQMSVAGPVAPSTPAPSIGMPARPAIAPPSVPAAVPATVAPPQAVRVAPPTPSYSRQAVAPARPSLSAADVYGGAVGTAQTSTPGTTVSRTTSFGPTYTTNKFGAVTATAPDGTQMAAWGGVPSRPAIAGPLNNTGISTPAAPYSGMFGPKAKAATGTVAGAAIGGFALGPLGAALGGLIGKNLAQGKAPLSGVFGGNASNPGTRTIDTYAGKMTFANPVGGLGFPSAPAAPKNTYSGSGGGALSKEARGALSSGPGLY